MSLFDFETWVSTDSGQLQYEDYDDVKTALMGAVMAALQERRPSAEKIGETAGRQAAQLLAKLKRRIDGFRLVGAAARGIAASYAYQHDPVLATQLASGSVFGIVQHLAQQEKSIPADADLADATKGKHGGADPGILKKDVDPPPETITQGIAEFRQDFAALLTHLQVKVLVVFIDDLDRCLPPNIVNTLEALRLFLAVPKTAFVIGADERIIKHAIATRYPEVPGQALDIGRDYLEKLIQVPIRIPPLTAAETESFLNLLGCELHLSADVHPQLVATVMENQRSNALDVVMNYGIAQTHLGAVCAKLEAHMALIGRIAPTLCNGLHGNPRQIKRFLNTLQLRVTLAKARGTELDVSVLAKLMILEYFHETHFRELFLWQAVGRGIAMQLEALELAGGTGEAGSPASPNDAQQDWVGNATIADWLRLEPPLRSVDLGPYFHFARDRVFTPTAPTRRLSQPLQELLGKLQSESDAERAGGMLQAGAMTADDLRPVYDTLLGRFQRDPRTLEGKLASAIVELAAKKRELLPALAQALRGTPPGAIRTDLPAMIRVKLGPREPLPAELQDVFQGWVDQTVASKLSQAAALALQQPRSS